MNVSFFIVSIRHEWGHTNYGLRERLNGIQEVSGSIPLISTNVELYEHNMAKSVFILLCQASYSSPHFQVGDNKLQPSNLAAIFLYRRVNRI